MAIVNVTGARTTGLLAGTSGVQTLGEVGLNGGRVRIVEDTVEITTPDATSTIWMARLPSWARLLYSSLVYWDDFASIGSPTLSIGCFNPTGLAGFTDSATALNSAGDLATPNTPTGFRLLSDFANNGKRLWEFTNATADPRQMIDIKGTVAAANANLSGTFSWSIFYTID